MTNRTAFFAVLSIVYISACAPVQPPKADPLKEEVIILQKQLLELQRLQIETRTKLDETGLALGAVSGKLQFLEERQARTLGQVPAEPRPAVTTSKKKPPSQKKKTARKVKKKVRRQE
jgi:hypothetical protein